MTAPPCPECQQGKHGNCDGETWDNDLDRPGACPCAAHGHHGDIADIAAEWLRRPGDGPSLTRWIADRPGPTAPRGGIQYGAVASDPIADLQRAADLADGRIPVFASEQVPPGHVLVGAYGLEPAVFETVGTDFERNTVTVRVEQALLTDAPSLIGFLPGSDKRTPEQREADRVAYEERVARREAEHRATYRARVHEATPLTLGALLEVLGWSAAYAEHRMHPLCTCSDHYGDLDLCEHARALGFTDPGDTPGERP